MRRYAGGALLGASLAGAGVAALEGAAVAAAGGGVRGCFATSAAAFALATTAALLAIALVALVRAALSALERMGIEWSTVLSSMVGASAAVLGAQALVLRVLSGQGIRTAVVTLSSAAGVGLGVALGCVVRALFKRTQRSATLELRSAVVVMALLALTWLAVALAPGLVEELDVPGLRAVLAPLFFGLVGALLGLGTPRLTRVATCVWLLLLLGAGVHASSPMPPKLAGVLQQRTDATRLYWEVARPGARTLPALKHPGTCRAGTAYGPLRGNGRAPQDAPDIVVVTTDAVRWDHTSMGGYARATTPLLQTWSESAAVFASAYSPASSTRQTFRALFTGLLPSQVPESRGKSWWGVTLPEGQRTLAGFLKDAGYLTINASHRREGFDAKAGALQGFAKQLPRTDGGDFAKARGARVRQQINQVLDALRAERKAPRFIWTHLMVAHQPYVYGEASAFGDEPIDRYDGAIHFLDGELARLLSTLRDEHRLDKTYILWSADHGQAFQEHHYKLHGYTTYQEETHVPLVIWGPGVNPGVRQAAVSTLDMFPTILDMARLGSVPAACGQSLLAALQDRGVALPRDVYSEQVPDAAPYFSVALTRGNYRLVVSPRTDSSELFDLHKDPSERHDISGEQPKVMATMLTALIDYQVAHNVDPRSYGLR